MLSRAKKRKKDNITSKSQSKNKKNWVTQSEEKSEKDKSDSDSVFGEDFAKNLENSEALSSSKNESTNDEENDYGCFGKQSDEEIE